MAERRPVIALVTDAIAPFHRGGKEQRYVELSRRLAERAEVHVYTMNWWKGARTRRDGAVTYHAICPLLPLYSGGRRSIRQAVVFAVCCLGLLFVRFDALEADHMPYMQLLPLKLVAKLKRRHLVVTWHECWGPEYWREYLGRPGRIGWFLESLAMRLPDVIIAASAQTAERLKELTGGRASVVVAPNGIDLDAIERVQAAPEAIDVVVVGRLLPHKKVDRLLDALALLNAAGRPVSALIVGSGPQLEHLRHQSQALGLGALIDFRDDIRSQHNLYGILKAARVAVFPSEREGFGIAVLEALACGVPVVTTSAPDNLARHLVERAGGSGMVCEPTAEALARAIADTLDGAHPLGPANRGWLKEYDWAAITESVASALCGDSTGPTQAAVSSSWWRRLLPATPSLLCLALMGMLLPLRSSWAVDLVLVVLALVVPGMIALRAANVSGTAVISYPVYIIAASLAVILTGGTIADLAGPHFGVGLPLHGVSTALTVLGLSLLLWIVGLRSPSAAQLPWRAMVGSPSLLAPLLIPALAAVGAILLSNGHGATVARISAIVTVLALFGCLLLAHRLNRWQVAALLFACSVAAEWAFSIRSQEILGFDISAEIHIAQHTQAVGIWHPRNPNNAYGAMLSVSLLPSTLAALTGLSPLIAFKVLFPVVGALFPLTAYFLAERVMSISFAAGAAALIIIQDYFFQLMPQLERQEIGLLFFAALVVALLDVRMSRSSRLVLIVVFAAGLVVSHYSSAYLAIPATAIALASQAIVGRWRDLPVVSVPLLCATVVLIGGTALWYIAITNSASNLTSFTSALDRKGLNLLPAGNGNIISSYISGNLTQPVDAARYEQLAVKYDRVHARWVKPLPQASQSRFALTSATAPARPIQAPAAETAIRIITTLVNELINVFGVLGALIMSLRSRGSPATRIIGLLAFATVAVLVVIRFSGTAAVAYNQQRALLQSLVLITVSAAWLAEKALTRLARARVPLQLGLALALAVVFASQSGVSALAIGGGTSLNLSASGEDYERQYMTPAELAGAGWATAQSRRQPLYSDRYGQLRLFASTGRVALTNLTPESINQYSWVYGTRTNVVLGRARGQIETVSSTYRWPGQFLDDYFNTVYTNGDSKVYYH